LASGNAVIENGIADLVAYGKLFIANPDLPERFRQNAPLNPPVESAFYGGDKHGYTDYPTLEKSTAA
jgi:N-ethylmaleimide reductase